MKRIRFAVCFLLIAAAACVFEQCYISDFCNNMDKKADKAIEYFEAKNEKGFKKSIKEIEKYWDKKNDLLFSVSGHVLLDELSIKIHALKGKQEAIYDVKAIVNAIYENCMIKTSNIL